MRRSGEILADNYTAEGTKELIPSRTHRTVAAIIVIGLIGQTLRNGIVDLLVVLLGGNEGACGGRLAVQVKVGTSTASGCESKSPDRARATTLLASLRGITAASRRAEALRGQGKTSRAYGRAERGGCWGGAQEGASSRASSGRHCDEI